MRDDIKLLRVKQIVGPAGLIPISRSAFYKAVAEGRFPKPYKLGPRTVAWSKSEILACLPTDNPKG